MTFVRQQFYYTCRFQFCSEKLWETFVQTIFGKDDIGKVSRRQINGGSEA